MELIYTDENLIDLGVLKEAVSDFAYGKDENNFEITTTKRSAKLIMGGYCYYEDTEYGGIVDAVEASNNDEEVKYGGRTWHGMLNSFIMTFESEYLSYDGNQYTILDGVQAAALIEDLVSNTGLPITVDTSFEAELTPVSVDARLGLYDFIVAALKPSRLKIYFRYNKGLTLYISGAADYDDADNFDYKQMSITASKGRKFTNHFILHNYEESENIHRTLHLYTDAAGNLQPYSLVDNPLRDEDYIYTDDNKVLTGADEVVTLLEGTSKIDNYRLEDASISTLDWRRLYTNYYEYVLKENSEDEYEYKQLKSEDDYIQLTSPPASWGYEWNRFYKEDGVDAQGNPKFTQLSEADNTANSRIKYRALTQNKYNPPVLEEDVEIITAAQWEKVWDTQDLYFTRTWNGNIWVYTGVQGREDYYWRWLASKPYKWDEEKGSYYINDKYTEYEVKQYIKTKGKYVYNGVTYKFNTHNRKNNKYKIGDKYLYQICKKLNKYYAAGATGTSSGKTIKTYWKKTKETVSNGMVTIETYQKRRGKGVGSFSMKNRKWSEIAARETKEKQLPPVWMEPNDSHTNPKGYFMKVQYSVGIPSFEYLVQHGYKIYALYDKFPAYQQNKFYLKVQDHFASLIEKAKEKLAEELDKLEEAKTDLNIETYEFDVGDYVGGINPLTNENFKSIVTKKIATIKATGSTVRYEIG